MQYDDIEMIEYIAVTLFTDKCIIGIFYDCDYDNVRMSF